MRFIKFVFIINIFISNIYIVDAQSAISFTKQNFDFGKIALEDSIFIAEFHFKSVGHDFLLIQDVIPDNDDVKVSWEKRIYQKGKEGVITARFEPKHEGVFQRKITLHINNTNRASFVLKIKGEVIKTGKQHIAKEENAAPSIHKVSYPTTFKMPSAYNGKGFQSGITNFNTYDIRVNSQGQTIFPIFDHGFEMTTRMIDFKRIKKGDKRTITFKIKNSTGEKRDIYFAPLFEYIEYKAIPKTLQAGEEGEISVTFDSGKCPIWGQYQADFSLITQEGSTAKNSPVLSFKVDTYEDYNSLSDDDKLSAPHAKFETTSIDFGKIDKSTTQKIKFNFSNAGKNPLEIRKIIPSRNINIVHCDGKVEQGKNGTLELELNPAKLNAGKYHETIILQTNDPQHPKTELKINWII